MYFLVNNRLTALYGLIAQGSVVSSHKYNYSAPYDYSASADAYLLGRDNPHDYVLRLVLSVCWCRAPPKDGSRQNYRSRELAKEKVGTRCLYSNDMKQAMYARFVRKSIDAS